GSDEGDILNERTKNPTFWILGLLLFVGLAVFAQAAGGIVIIDSGAAGAVVIPGAVVIDSFGRIVVAGSSHGAFTLARHNSDGSLDKTFGGDTGFVVIANIGGSGVFEFAATLAIDSFGRIVAGGAAATPVGISLSGYRYDFALVRCNSDGTLD